jgi:hypothetical protein
MEFLLITESSRIALSLRPRKSRYRSKVLILTHRHHAGDRVRTG